MPSFQRSYKRSVGAAFKLMNDENTWDFPATSNGWKVVAHELYFQLLSRFPRSAEEAQVLCSTDFSIPEALRYPPFVFVFQGPI